MTLKINNSGKQQVFNMAFLGRLVINLFWLTALLYPMQALATDDEYLKMLEAEAEDLELDQSGRLEQNQQTDEEVAKSLIDANLKSAGTVEGNILPENMSQGGFVTALKDNFFGSYIFYQKLDSNDQHTVYYHYTKASPAYLDAIRQEILDLIKER